MSIDVEHLSFSYGSHHVLRDLSFRIPDNTLVKDVYKRQASQWPGRR